MACRPASSASVAACSGPPQGCPETADGALQKNALSAAGVGATTTVGGIFTASAGASACLKLYRSRVTGQQPDPHTQDDQGSDGDTQSDSLDDVVVRK